MNNKSIRPKSGDDSKVLTQVEALIAQAAAVARFQATGDAADASEIQRLERISRVQIGPFGELLLDATYVTHSCTENTGGGAMVDFLFMKDGRVIALNDECISVYGTKDTFYDGEMAPLHSMWIELRQTSRESSQSSATQQGEHAIVKAAHESGHAYRSSHAIAQDLQADPMVLLAAQAAKASQGASSTFLRRDQCSHGHADSEGLALYKELLVELHKVGDVLMTKPRGTYANMAGSMLWVSPLKNNAGADLFIYAAGGLYPEDDGNGTYPLAYFDELGVGIEVVETTANLRTWLNNPVFGQMTPDYLLDQIASFADCCRYEEFAPYIKG